MHAWSRLQIAAEALRTLREAEQQQKERLDTRGAQHLLAM